MDGCEMKWETQEVRVWKYEQGVPWKLLCRGMFGSSELGISRALIPYLCLYYWRKP